MSLYFFTSNTVNRWGKSKRTLPCEPPFLVRTHNNLRSYPWGEKKVIDWERIKTDAATLRNQSLTFSLQIVIYFLTQRSKHISYLLINST